MPNLCGQALFLPLQEGFAAAEFVQLLLRRKLWQAAEIFRAEFLHRFFPQAAAVGFEHTLTLAGKAVFGQVGLPLRHGRHILDAGLHDAAADVVLIRRIQTRHEGKASTSAAVTASQPIRVRRCLRRAASSV